MRLRKSDILARTIPVFLSEDEEVMICLARMDVRDVTTTQRSIWVSVDAEVVEVNVGEKAEGADSRKVDKRRGCS
jgi:hypothetical protein